MRHIKWAVAVICCLLVVGLGATSGTLLERAAELHKEGENPVRALLLATVGSEEGKLSRVERKFRKKLDAVQHYPMAVLMCSDEQAAALGTLTKDGNCVSLASDGKNQTKEDFLRSLTQRMTTKNESALTLGEQCFICGDNSTPEFRYIGGGSRG